MSEIITDIHGATPVPEAIAEAVAEGEAAGIVPRVRPQPSTPDNPRAHLPVYDGHMRGVLPADHPVTQRQSAQRRKIKAREAARAQQQLAVEASVPKRFRLGTRVRIQGNAKVDFTDEDGVRHSGDYQGIEGEVYQTYVDPEGNRRAIVLDRSPETGGMSAYAPVAVRERDLIATKDRPVLSLARGLTPAERAERAARAAAGDESLERAAFGGRTAAELAALMCGE